MRCKTAANTVGKTAAKIVAQSGVDARKADCVGLVLENPVGPGRPVERHRREKSMALDPETVDAADRTSRSRLKLLCVGTGRDGTQSLNHMIQRVYGQTVGRQSVHEYCCREIYQTFCDFSETGDGSRAEALKRMVADCPYDSIVSNGYAALLPLFAEHYGRGLKVPHLYRDREACIESLTTNCELFPTAYRYYSSSPEAEVKRMAAFHFGDLPRAEWDRLPLREKFGWDYDKTHP